MNATRLKPRVNPTNADLAEAIRELHDCVHSVGEKADDNHRAVLGEIGTVKERVSGLEGWQKGIGQRLGVSVDPAAQAPAPVQKKAWFPTPWQVLGSIGGIAALYAVLDAIAPALRDVLLKIAGV